MSQNSHREVEHTISVDMPAEDVYRLIADVAQWPRIFPPTIHVDHAEKTGRSERIRIWATANGEVRTWTSRRALDAKALRIDFRQEVTQPPAAGMGGSWIIERTASDRSLVRLLHDYRALDDDPERLAWLDKAVDTNSRSELAALKANVEAVSGTNERLTFTFEDSVTVDGSAKDVYDFLNDAQHWEERLPHVARVALTEDDLGLQVLEMDTRIKNGSTHTTKSVRVCLPPQRIVYKQITLPALMSLHTGCWELTEPQAGGSAVTVVSRHTVTIREDAIVTALGSGADLTQARQFVREALGTNSLTTLRHAKEHAESRR